MSAPGVRGTVTYGFKGQAVWWQEGGGQRLQAGAVLVAQWKGSASGPVTFSFAHQLSTSGLNLTFSAPGFVPSRPNATTLRLTLKRTVTPTGGSATLSYWGGKRVTLSGNGLYGLSGGFVPTLQVGGRPVKALPAISAAVCAAPDGWTLPARCGVGG